MNKLVDQKQTQSNIQMQQKQNFFGIIYGGKKNITKHQNGLAILKMN